MFAAVSRYWTAKAWKSAVANVTKWSKRNTTACCLWNWRHSQCAQANRQDDARRLSCRSPSNVRCSTTFEGERSMLRSMKDLENYAIGATDGTIGHVKDFYFDDKAWVIRYLVVDAGAWLSNRQVLISPIAIGHPNWAEKILPVSITKEQVRNSPDIDTQKPVSRQHEMDHLSYYGYPYY